MKSFKGIAYYLRDRFRHMKTESTIIKDIRKSVLNMECPVCGSRTMESTVAVLDLPMLGEAVETTLVCPECGFRTSDVMITEQNEAVRYTLRVEKPEDISARVVRSTSGTIRIPELGILIEPGPASESFISNIEGVLMRVRNIVEGLRDEKKEANKKIDEIDRAREGLIKFTFILEDPYGNSAILSEKAKKERLSTEEANLLRKGELNTSL